jgi:hypothetical protein
MQEPSELDELRDRCARLHAQDRLTASQLAEIEKHIHELQAIISIAARSSHSDDDEDSPSAS